MLFAKKNILFDNLNCSQKLRKSLLLYNNKTLNKNFSLKLNNSTKNYVKEILCQLRKTYRCGFRPKMKKKLQRFIILFFYKQKEDLLFG